MIKTKEWDIFVDKDFAYWCSTHNIEWNDSNFFVSDNVGVLSNCCRLLSDTSRLDSFKQENKDIIAAVKDEIYRLYQQEMKNE